MLKSFDSYLKNANKNSFFISPTTEKDVEDILGTRKTHKSVGPGNIPTRILKEFKKYFSKPTSDLINLSFPSGTIPEIIKQAKVISIFKKGDQQNYNNYRPISLLSNINNIIEKLIHKQLYGFLENNNCLYVHQFGFRNNHSTNHALIRITEKITNALDDGKITCGVFLDLQKVFDTVDHQILLSKLEHYGIRGTPLNWFKSYLTNRHQFLLINNVQLETFFNEYGVPQCSVLSPLLSLTLICERG